MSADYLRALRAAHLRVGKPPPPPIAAIEESHPAGLAYVCRRCEVYGYAGPDEAQVCWSCGLADRLEQR